MTCPGCHSAEIPMDTRRCWFCDRQLRHDEWLAYLNQLPLPTRALEEDRFDYALREA